MGARGSTASRGSPALVPAVLSARRRLGERRRWRLAAPAENQAWASTPNCPEGETEDRGGLEPHPSAFEEMERLWVLAGAENQIWCWLLQAWRDVGGSLDCSTSRLARD